MAKDVYSTTPDVRSSFPIAHATPDGEPPATLACPRTSASHPNADGRPPPQSCARPRTILLMDDKPEILTLVQQILEDDGHQVITSPRLLAPEAVCALNPDLIVLELLFDHRPDGWAFLESARRMPALCQIPILLLTAAAEQTKPRAPELVANGIDVVAKPFDIDELLGVVHVHLADAPRSARGFDAD